MFFQLFSKWVSFTSLAMKTILNRFIKCSLVKCTDWANFFWLFEKKWFFPFLTQHLLSKKWNCSKVRKSYFWWLIWACHSLFSRYRVLKYQNWVKIVVFTNFFLLSVTFILLQILIVKFLKKSLVLRNGSFNLSNFLHAARNWRDNGSLLVSLFHGFIFKNIFPLFPLFSVNQKGVFSTFLKMGKFYVFGHENHSKRVHKVRLSDMFWLDQLFLTFWKKVIFNVSDSTFFIKKIKLFKSDKKWGLMADLRLP